MSEQQQTRPKRAETYFSEKTKNHLLASVSEFVGTVLFLIFSLGATSVANNPAFTPNDYVGTSNLLYIALAFGFSLTVNAWVFFRVSGGLFNPAITLGMCLVGAIPISRAVMYVIAQIVGAIAGSAIILAITPGSLYAQCTLGPNTNVAQGLFIEMFLTSMLMLAIFMLATEKHKATFLAPIGIGLSLFVVELFGLYYTGGAVNPARAFGPAVVLGKFYRYHWIYWLGPCMGAILAAGVYVFFKQFNYETVQPDSAEGTLLAGHVIETDSKPGLTLAADPDGNDPFKIEKKERDSLDQDTINSRLGRIESLLERILHRKEMSAIPSSSHITPRGPDAV